jgi:hypothetical protein
VPKPTSRIRRGSDLLARAQHRVAFAAIAPHRDFEEPVRAAEYRRAEIERNREDAVADSHRGILDGATDLAAAGEGIEQAETHLVGRLRCPRIRELALIAELGGLSRDHLWRPEHQNDY